MTAALPALALIGTLLLALGGAPRRHASQIAAMVLCTVGAVLALGVLLASAPATTIALPVGLPGVGTTLALDGLAAFFIFLLLATAAAVSLVGQCPPLVGTIVLTLLAADTFALAFGMAATALAIALLLRDTAPDVRPDNLPAAPRAMTFGFGGAIGLLAALALAGPWQFEAIRLHPPDGWRGIAIVALALLGAGSFSACGSGAPIRAAVPPAPAALLAGAVPNLALYIVARALFDLCGPGQPLGWGVLLVVLGSIAAVSRAARACFAADMQSAIAAAGGAQTGLTLIGFGLAWIARSADLTTLAALAIGAALLNATAHALVTALLALCGSAAEQGAGTRAFARLGGLIHRMPVTTAATLAGLTSLAALPPSAGFASLWTLFQAILGAPPSGGFGMGTVVCAVAASVALASALLAAAALRLLGIAFLGRPRSPRAAAAVEVSRQWRSAMLILAGLLAAIGLFPAALIALARPALRVLLPAHEPDSARLLSISGANDGSLYTASGLAVMLALGAGLAALAIRRGVQGHVAEPAWESGFDAPPAWMPFGDPATQVSATSFSASLAGSIGRLVAPRPAWAGRLSLGRLTVPPLTSRGATVLGGAAAAAIVIGIAAALALR